MFADMIKQSIPLVEVRRSGVVECVHRGSIAIVENGKLIGSIGNPYTVTPERSTAKPFQILSLLKNGGIDAFCLELEEIAVMVSSHNGEDRHVQTVRNILKKACIDEHRLACGIHPPFFFSITESLFWHTCSGPRPIHNNCSGKHAGMLLLGKLLGKSLESYWRLDHPIQQTILAEVAESLELNPSQLKTGIDGCGVPTYFVRLDQLAGAYCKLASSMYSEEFNMLGIVKDAMLTHPFMVAGTSRLDTDLMTNLPIIGKAGAQAVYCLAIPSKCIGISIKVESGCEDASETVAVEILRQLGLVADQELAALEKYWHRPILTCTGQIVGHYQPIF